MRLLAAAALAAIVKIVAAEFWTDLGTWFVIIGGALGWISFILRVFVDRPRNKRVDALLDSSATVAAEVLPGLPKDIRQEIGAEPTDEAQ